MKHNKRVLVAMSGGVDSSTAACLLVKQGFDVIGISLKLFSAKNETAEGCCGLSGIDDARKVASQLNIPFYVVNCEKDFNKNVISYFCSEYLNGRTPNPCVLCNETTKFNIVLKKAKELDADFIATGHYAIIEKDKKTGRYLLKKGNDKEKDQSYFLSRLKQEQLKYSLFPLGKYTKEKVRELAKKNELKVYNKPGSQEICFIPDNNYHNFLNSQLTESSFKPGPIVDSKGMASGKHKGIAFYTIGQRKGIGSHSTRAYVTHIDSKTNTIIIGEEKNLYKKEFIADCANWISIKDLAKPVKAKVRIRYKHHESEAEISPIATDKVKITFLKPQKSVTPGQLAVFYKGNTVIGSGWIQGDN